MYTQFKEKITGCPYQLIELRNITITDNGTNVRSLVNFYHQCKHGIHVYIDATIKVDQTPDIIRRSNEPLRYQWYKP